MNAAVGSAESARQVLRNGTFLLLAYVAPRFFTVGSVVVAARWLGAERFGVYGAAAAFAVIMSVLASLGMLPLLIREIARAPDRSEALLASAHRIKAMSGVAMLGVAWLLSGVLFADLPEARMAAMVLCVGWALHAFAENVAAYFQAVERMARWTQASALFGVVSSAVGVVLLLSTNSIVAFCWGFVAGWACGLAWLVAGLPARSRGAIATNGAPVGELLRGLAPFAAAFIGLTIYCKVDVLLLGRWSDSVQVGLYTAAYKFVDVFQALVIVAAGAVYPRLSRSGGPGSFRSSGGRRATEFLLLGAVPAGLTLYLLASPAVSVLFGEAYRGSTEALSALALLLPLLAVSILGAYVLGASDRMSSVAVLYVVGVACNVGLNRWLIPSFGAEGAAWARVGSEAVLLVGFMTALAKHADAAPKRRTLVIALAGAPIAALATLLPDLTGGWLRAVVFLATVAVIYERAGVWRSSGAADLLDAVVRNRRAPTTSPEVA